jgi:HK97 family phage major capsid protein
LAATATADAGMDTAPQQTDSKKTLALLGQIAELVAEAKVLIDEGESAPDEESPDDAEARSSLIEDVQGRAGKLWKQVLRNRKIAAEQAEMRKNAIASVRSSRGEGRSAGRDAGGEDAGDVDGEGDADRRGADGFQSRSRRSGEGEGESRTFARPTRGELKAFGSGVDAEKRAFEVGHVVLAAFAGNARSRKYCQEHGLLKRAQNTDDDSAVIPTILSDEVIKFIDEHGVFRRNTRLVPMKGGEQRQPRRLKGLKMKPMKQLQNAAQSQREWDDVQFIAKKFAVDNRYSTEVSEDAIIELGSDTVYEIGLAFAEGMDDCGFNGDGDPDGDYLGIKGIIPSMLEAYDGSPRKGLYYAAADAVEDFDEDDFIFAMARLPQFAWTPTLRWFCSPAVYAASMQRLKFKKQGNTGNDISNGFAQPFGGVPVELVNVMDNVLGSDPGKVKFVLGDLRLGTALGMRRELTYKTSTELLMASDEVLAIATSRFDIKVHGTGTDEKAGPIIVIATAEGS